MPSPSGASVVYLRDADAVGINHAVALGYYYYSGAVNPGPGWRRLGSAFTQLKDDDALPPDAVLVVRHNVAGDTQWTLAGAVPMTPAHLDAGTLLANTAQDVHLPVPSLATVDVGGVEYINLTLANCRLLETGAILGNSA